MRIFNGTPHEITVIADDCIECNATIRKYIVRDGAELNIVARIPSDGVLSAKIETVQTKAIGNIPVFGKKIVGCDPVPSEYDVVVVSALYAAAAQAAGYDVSRLYTIGDPVYSRDGRTILGCRGIAKVE